MKKLLGLIIFIFSLYTIAIAADAKKMICLNIKFDAAPNGSFYEKPIKFHKKIKLDLNDPNTYILMTQSKMVDNYPVTLVLSVNPTIKDKNQLELAFNLVNYGLKQASSIITQPKIIVANGEAAEIKIDKAFDLKVDAKWDAKIAIV